MLFSVSCRASRRLAFRAGLAGVLIGAFSAPAIAQTLPPAGNTVNLSGPRFGLTVMSSGVGRELDKRNIDVGSTISQFGWQWEKQFFTSESAGLTMVSEWVALGGGLEQNVLLPSVSWLIGLRTTNGVEFGMGPNLTPAGFALVLAGGMTFRTGLANVPLNVAVVPSKMGTRVSVLSGFSLRREASASRQPVARRAPPRVAPWPPVPVGPWTPPFVGPGTPARVRPQVGALP